MTDKLKAGWHSVTERTELRINHYGAPVQVRTTRYNLDAALNDAAEYNGVPLERVSPWLTDDGRDPERTDTGNNSLVTCKVRQQETP